MSQSRNSGTRYPVEFKKSSAKLAIEADQKISKTANDLNIDPATLRSWINKSYPNHHTHTSADMTPEKLLEENKQLRKLLARTTQERDILKKATAYFAKESL